MMESLFVGILIPLLVLAAIIGGIVYGLNAWRRRDTDHEPDSGIGTPRRIYFYFISFVALMMLASGVNTVLMAMLDELFGDAVIRGSTTRLATGLALTLVGLPLWLFHWRFIQRSASEMPVERRSILRKLHIYGAAAVALVVAGVASYGILENLMRVTEFSAFSWSAVLVWLPVWGYYWKIASDESPETTLETRGIRRLYLYVASALGLALLAGGAGSLIYFVLRAGYTAVFEVGIVEADVGGLWVEAARTSASVTIVGAVIWSTHWLRFASSDRHSALRWLYLFVAYIGGGAVPALVGLGLILNAAISWLVGATVEPTVDHFSILPIGVATLATGVALWAYYTRYLRAEAEGTAAVSVRRSQDLFLAAIGLVALVSASAVILDTAFRTVAETSPLVTSGQTLWRSRLAAALTMLLIGVPVWFTRWRRLQLAAESDPGAERTALPRKIYVLGALCIGILALVGSASSTLFLFLRDLLEAQLSADTLRDLATPLAITLTAVLVLPYHWMVYRQDRLLEPDTPEDETRPVRKRITVLVAPGGSDLVTRIETALGYDVVAAHWSDPEAFVPVLDDERLNQTAETVSTAPGATVLLIPVEDGLNVLSYD